MKDVPGSTIEDVYYTRDTGGRITKAAFGSTGGTPQVEYVYDARGNTVSEGDGLNKVLSQYDLASNRTRVSFGMGYNEYDYNVYTYDLANRLTKIEHGASGVPTPTVVATLNYGTLNRRCSLVRPNGTQTAYTYDGAGRTASVVHTGPASSVGSSQTFTYNPAGQALTQAQATAAYLWTGHPTSTKNATHDGLNRDAAIVAASGYDANGNLTSDGVRTFTYDIENRLTSATGGANPIAIAYDPIGRIRQVTVGGTSTPFYYDGVRLVAEGGSLIGPVRQYVHGVGIDEPIVWYEGAVANWLHADRQGSIVATSDSAGVMSPYTYGPYGEPQSWAGSRFRYTGQISIPEAQLNHYKARVYDPIAGRFLQTDPSGYEGGPNVYAYVSGDPTNKIDPTGLCSVAYDTPEGDVVAGPIGNDCWGGERGV